MELTCDRLRESGAVANALQRVQRPDSLTRTCAAPTTRVGEACVDASEASDPIANTFRCNLTCLHERARSDELRAFYQGQCALLGDTSCAFAHLDCAQVAETMRTFDQSPAPPAPAPSSEAPPELQQSNVHTRALALAFKKTQMLHRVAEGVRAAIHPRDGAGEGAEGGRDPLFVAGQTNPVIQSTLMPSRLHGADQDAYADTLIRSMPVITALHDMCCGDREGVSLLAVDAFDAGAARAEIDKIAELVDRLDVAEYNPLAQCVDGTPVGAHCPTFDL